MEGRSVDSGPAYSMCTFLFGGMEIREGAEVVGVSGWTNSVKPERDIMLLVEW